MKFAAFLLSLIAVAASYASCELPADYRAKIRAALVSQRLPQGEFFCDFYEPKRVLVGEAKQERCAVRCDWGVRRKTGAMPVLIVRAVFVFDGETLVELKGDAPVEWPDGPPTSQAKENA